VTASNAKGETSVVIISAPSGSGKSTVVDRLLDSMPALWFSVSHTTRPRRQGEKNGREYFFVTPARFKEMIAAREFVEWAKVYGNFYGTSRQQIEAARKAGKDILLDIDVQGHRKVRRKLPQAVSVFLLPPSYEELKRRLRKRKSETPATIERRLAAARQEIKHWPEYDYIVVNADVTPAARALQAIVVASRARRENQGGEIKRICKTFGG
jgi:guanylate kinase